MQVEQFIAPSGVIAFILFALSFASGFERLGIERFHKAFSYACLITVVVHSAAAFYCSIIEPLGVLASAGMVLTAASGALRWKRTHIALAFATLALSIAHVGLIQYLK